MRSVEDFDGFESYRERGNDRQLLLNSSMFGIYMPTEYIWSWFEATTTSPVPSPKRTEHILLQKSVGFPKVAF